jgi:DNA ligase (NAD+)
MSIDSIKSQIIDANNAYRNGNSIISDEEYDSLLEDLESELDFIEFVSFQKTLTESKGTVANSYVLGSLTKFKFEESDKFIKWLKDQKINEVFVSDKIDGCSFYAEYRNGKLTLLTSRGDGDEGTDWTPKAPYINIPQTISNTDPIDIRGEVTIHQDGVDVLGFKNKRSGTAGIMNAKDVDPTRLKYIHAYTYEVLSGNMTIESQFTFLDNLGFKTSGIGFFDVTNDLHEQLKVWYDHRRSNAMYAMDGLVISDANYVPENTFYPKSKIAFKINSTGVETTVIGIEWNISKGGLLKPVVLVEPTEIDGTTVQRATGYNAKFIQENKIQKGTKVLLIKSGEVIPKIIKVIG